LQLLFDTANLLAVNDDPLTVLDAVLPRVAAVHVSDIRQAGSFDPVLIGTGVTPLNAIFERFRNAGFNGWISVEEASKTGEEGFRQAIPIVKRLWLN